MYSFFSLFVSIHAELLHNTMGIVGPAFDGSPYNMAIDIKGSSSVHGYNFILVLILLDGLSCSMMTGVDPVDC